MINEKSNEGLEFVGKQLVSQWYRNAYHSYCMLTRAYNLPIINYDLFKHIVLLNVNTSKFPFPRDHNKSSIFSTVPQSRWNLEAISQIIKFNSDILNILLYNVITTYPNLYTNVH